MEREEENMRARANDKMGALEESERAHSSCYFVTFPAERKKKGKRKIRRKEERKIEINKKEATRGVVALGWQRR